MELFISLEYDKENDTLTYENKDLPESDNLNEEILLLHLLYTKLRLEGLSKEETREYIDGLEEIVEEVDNKLVQKDDIITVYRNFFPEGGTYLSLFKMNVGGFKEEKNPKTYDNGMVTIIVLAGSILAFVFVTKRLIKKSR